VNVRFCLDHLNRGHAIAAKEAADAMTSLKELDLEERDPRGIMLRLAGVLGRSRAKELLRRLKMAAVDVKRNDAYQLLRSVARRKDQSTTHQANDSNETLGQVPT
jgi:hypothetical protein